MANIKIKSGPTTIGNAKTGYATTQPRSFLDILTGKSTVSYSRPTKQPMQKSVNKAFKSYGPTSNGKGVGP